MKALFGLPVLASPVFQNAFSKRLPIVGNSGCFKTGEFPDNQFQTLAVIFHLSEANIDKPGGDASS
ncbi:hypothetical protein COLO4_13205 [Corchorus olitorius]|uniref:Uncharacterized protein n=1 Tax=Corchorus olitorius TaxID=93759 RepID=A0A1R3JXK6_9ROSI|nr:hypothetical protein COLO4_13205 [Corchorus olitorius]